MHKPIRREFLRRLVKIDTDDYLLTRNYKYSYLPRPYVQDVYSIYRTDKLSNNWEYLGDWEYK